MSPTGRLPDSHWKPPLHQLPREPGSPFRKLWASLTPDEKTAFFQLLVRELTR